MKNLFDGRLRLLLIFWMFLMSAIAYLDRGKTVKQLRRMEQLWEEKNIYYQAEKRVLPSWAAESQPDKRTFRKNRRSS